MSRRSRAIRLNNIGVDYSKRGDFATALRYFRRAYRLYPSPKIRRNIHIAKGGQLNRWGVQYSRRGDYLSALRYFRQAARYDPHNRTIRRNIRLMTSALRKRNHRARAAKRRALAARRRARARRRALAARRRARARQRALAARRRAEASRLVRQARKIEAREKRRSRLLTGPHVKTGHVPPPSVPAAKPCLKIHNCYRVGRGRQLIIDTRFKLLDASTVGGHGPGGAAATLGKWQFTYSLARHKQGTIAPPKARDPFLVITLEGPSAQAAIGTRTGPGSVEHRVGFGASLTGVDVKVYAPFPGGVRIIGGAGASVGGGGMGLVQKTLADKQGYTTEATGWASALAGASLTVGLKFNRREWRQCRSDLRTIFNWASGSFRGPTGGTPAGPIYPQP